MGEYCSHVKLADLSKDRSLLSLYNCTANIIDDIQQVKNIDLAKIQSIVSGATFNITRAGGVELEFRPYATLLIATTNMLQFKDFNKSLVRRFKVIPFPASFDNSSDVDMRATICQPKYLDIIATMAIQAYNRVLSDKHFHIPASIEEDTLNYFFEGNSAIAFIMQHSINMIVSKGYYYSQYSLWCMRNDLVDVGYQKFCSTVLDFGYMPNRWTFDKVRDQYYTIPDLSKSKVELEYQQYCNSLAEGSEPMDINNYIQSLNNNMLK